MVGELAHFVGVEVFGFKTAAGELEAVEVGGVILFESTDEGLHIELRASLVLAEVGEADFDFIAEFSSFFFGFGDASLVALGELDLSRVAGAASGRTEEGAESFNPPSPVWTNAKEWFATGFDFFDPFVGGLFVPIVRNRAGENLNPKFLGSVRTELRKRAGDASERVDFEVVESFDGESFIFDEVELGGIDNRIFLTVVDVIVVHFVNLDGRVLGINLTFDETLEDFWHPDVETDLTASRDNFEAQVFLDAARVFQFFGIAQNTVKTSEKLFGGQFLLVVGTRDLEHE